MLSSKIEYFLEGREGVVKRPQTFHTSQGSQKVCRTPLITTRRPVLHVNPYKLRLGPVLLCRAPVGLGVKGAVPHAALPTWSKLHVSAEDNASEVWLNAVHL